MRFVWAVVAFVLAAVMIGAGIAQRTIFEAPEAETTTVTVDDGARYVVIDGGVLNMLPGAQRLTVDGDGAVFAAYGRTADMLAWVSDAEYDHVTAGSDGTTRTTLVEPETDPDATAEEGSAVPGPGTEAPAARNPVGSDLWLDEFQQDGGLTTPLQLPDTMSVLVASDGTQPAPSTITVTWPVDASTPWAVPLMVGGGILLLAGLVLYVLGIRHARRSRGPRRRGLPLPVTEPIDLSVEKADKGVVSAGAPTRRRALPRGRRSFVVATVAVSGVLLAGCAPSVSPQSGPAATPSPTASVIVPEGQQAPAVTEAQAKRILTRISETVAEADAALDPTLAASRLSGAALAERETNYTLRGQIADRPAIEAIPDQPVQIILPQAFDEWPRSFLAVVENADDTTAAPTILLATQEDPWSDYKVASLASLEASTLLPDLAASYVGAVLTPPDSPFLLLPPEELSAAYADIIDNGENSQYADLFDIAGDRLLPAIATNRQARLDELNQTGVGTAELTFQATATDTDPLALTTLDGGAIVAVTVTENDTVRATNEDAVIRLENNETVRTLTGLDQSATGFTTTYLDQVYFYVPLEGSGERIRLLGYRTNILEAKEIS